jgi:uncharacterized FlgJ-related protein
MQQILDFIKDNIKWIIFLVIILIISNLLTGISVNSLSKKDKKKAQKKLDSLETKYKQLDFIHIHELEYRRKIFLEDSILQIKYLQEKNKDKVLIIKQKEALNKFKSNSSKVNISKLDSAYEAEN